MMGKINTGKFDGIETARAGRSGEVSQAGKKRTSATAGAKTEQADRVEFSVRAEIVGKAMEAIRELPDVREDVVSAFREKIASGSYHPSSSDIADAILRDESA